MVLVKTVEIPVSQLLKIHRLIKILLDLKLGKTADILLKEIEECAIVTD